MLAALPVLQLALLRTPSTLPSSLHSTAARAPHTFMNVIHQPSVDKPNPEDPFFKQSGSVYAEESRKYRRTVYMHDEWVKHRSSERFIKNLATIADSGVASGLGKELLTVTSVAVFAVAINMFVHGYQDFSGMVHPSMLDESLARNLKQIALPTLPFTIAMPALSLLLVFRTNTAYFRWNEARTLWGGVVNSCRNVVRQSNTYFPDTPEMNHLKDILAYNTAAFAKALRNFLRGPADDEQFRKELMDIVNMGLMSESQVNACMAAKNRPMFMLNAMSAAVRKADIDPIDKSRIDASISTLVDLTGACERVFKSPIPLVYTRHTSRFLATFLLLMPFGIWPVMGDSWNHWATIPATTIISFFLLGIEEIGIQIEEPFSILPLEALANGAIAATIEELLSAFRDPEAYDFPPLPSETMAASPVKSLEAEFTETVSAVTAAEGVGTVVSTQMAESDDKKAGVFSRLWGNK